MKTVIYIMLAGLIITNLSFAQETEDPVYTPKKEFYKLYSELLEYRKQPEVQLSSMTLTYNNCEAFRKIVEKGRFFLPFIIEEIKKGDFFLNQAMREITGFNMRTTPETKVASGEQDISKLWTEWWEKNKDKYPS